MKYVLTGQPPDRPGRVALGPLLSKDAAEDLDYIVRRRGWTEVWLLPLDEKFLATLMAGADGAEEVR